MGKWNFFIVAIVFFSLVSLHQSYAADSMAQKTYQAGMVQLRSEHNRIEALTAARKYDAVEEVKQDAQAVSAAMTRDFKDHFTFCPVYYFADTNADLIKQKQFDGVLMNADGTPAKNIVINAKSRKYLIVYYGYPTSQSRATTKVKDKNKYEYDSGEPMGKGLVINDYNYYQVSFLYKFGYDDVSFKSKKNRDYTYRSRHFDIEYFPFAKEFNKKLTDQNDKIRISHVNGFTE